MRHFDRFEIYMAVVTYMQDGKVYHVDVPVLALFNDHIIVERPIELCLIIRSVHSSLKRPIGVFRIIRSFQFSMLRPIGIVLIIIF